MAYKLTPINPEDINPEEAQKAFEELLEIYVWRNADGEVVDFPGYEYADNHTKECYNPDGSMKEYYARGSSPKEISDRETRVKRQLKNLSEQVVAYEQRWGVKPSPIPEISDDVILKANKQAIRDGDDPSELPYAMDLEDYYDLKQGSDPTRFL